jgi:hypothetical protein
MSSGTAAQPRPEICGERKLVAELVWGGQSGGAEEWFSIVRISTRDGMNRLALPIVGGGLKTKEVKREVHRCILVGGNGAYRHA